MQSFMDVLDRPTLSIFASIMWLLGLLVMFSIFAARLGGDEFVVLAHSISANDPRGAVLQRLREAVDGPLALAQCTLPVSISISVGIAMWPTDGTDAEQLLHVADEQMYLDKQAWRRACA